MPGAIAYKYMIDTTPPYTDDQVASLRACDKLGSFVRQRCPNPRCHGEPVTFINDDGLRETMRVACALVFHDGGAICPQCGTNLTAFPVWKIDWFWLFIEAAIGGALGVRPRQFDITFTTGDHSHRATLVGRGTSLWVCTVRGYSPIYLRYDAVQEPSAFRAIDGWSQFSQHERAIDALLAGVARTTGDPQVDSFTIHKAGTL